MSDRTSIHIDEELLERYAMAKPIDGEQLELLEEHLLLCPRCQVRLEKLDQFLPAVASAAQTIVDKDARPAERPPWTNYAARATLLAAAASLAFFFFVPKQGDLSHEEVALTLSSTRDVGQVKGPARRPLRLNLDLTGLEDSKPTHYDVVSLEGELIHRQSLSRNEANPALPAGRYWIRIKATPTGPPLREFSLYLR
jgi:hypothetical protein